jgi:hypothetical protein
VSILFENVDDIDLKTGQFITGATAGDAHFTLRFKIEKSGVVSGCLGDVCFTGKRVEKFPHYLAKLDKGLDSRKPLEVAGKYHGVLKMYSGNPMAGDLEIDALHGKYTGGMRLTNGIFMAFPDGLQENKQGLVYISGPAYSVRALHQFRGFINSKGQLEGVWVSTNIGKVADFVFSKVKK